MYASTTPSLPINDGVKGKRMRKNAPPHGPTEFLLSEMGYPRRFGLKDLGLSADFGIRQMPLAAFCLELGGL